MAVDDQVVDPAVLAEHCERISGAGDEDLAGAAEATQAFSVGYELAQARLETRSIRDRDDRAVRVVAEGEVAHPAQDRVTHRHRLDRRQTVDPAADLIHGDVAALLDREALRMALALDELDLGTGPLGHSPERVSDHARLLEGAVGRRMADPHDVGGVVARADRVDVEEVVDVVEERVRLQHRVVPRRQSDDASAVVEVDDLLAEVADLRAKILDDGIVLAETREPVDAEDRWRHPPQA